MSIEFQCPGCDNEMEVGDNMAGQRGKCPKCGRIITVPQRSSREMVFASAEQGYFRSKRLNNLFESFLDKYSDNIKSCRLPDSQNGVDGALLEIYTGNGRTQIVIIAAGDAGSEEVLIGSSRIGIHPEGLGFVDILKDVAMNLVSYPTYSLFIDQLSDGRMEIGLRKATRLKHVDEQAFYNFTIRLAQIADAIEGKHYDNDVN